MPPARGPVTVRRMSLRILHFSDVHLPFPAGAFRTPELFHPKRLVALVKAGGRDNG